MLKLTVKLENGVLHIQPRGIRLNLRDGAIAELRISEGDIEDDGLRAVLAHEASYALLPEGTRLMSFVSTEERSEHVVRDLRVTQAPGSVWVGYVAIELRESLVLDVKPPRRPKLRDSECWIPALKTVVKSLNEGHTRISALFEPQRRSHHGNVFKRVFVEVPNSGNSIWVPLEQFRWAAEVKHAASADRLMRSTPETAAAKSQYQAAEESAPTLERPLAQSTDAMTHALHSLLEARMAATLASVHTAHEIQRPSREALPFSSSICLELHLPPTSTMAQSLTQIGLSAPELCHVTAVSPHAVQLRLPAVVDGLRSDGYYAGGEAALRVLRDRLGIRGYVPDFEVYGNDTARETAV